MLASKVIPQVDSHVKKGSAKVLRSRMLKENASSWQKLAKSEKRNF